MANTGEQPKYKIVIQIFPTFEKGYQMRCKLLCLLTGLTLFLGACETTFDKAQELEKKELFLEASRMYEKAVKEEPENVKAKEGLYRVRNKHIDRKLIEVRMARLAGNQQQSLDMLHAITEKEKEWEVYPVGKVAFTQDEETRKLFPHLKGLISRANSNTHPLKSRFLLAKYRIVFNQPDYSPSYADLLRQTNQLGKQTCENFDQNQLISKPALSDYASSFCQFFNVAYQEPEKTKKTRQQRYFSDIDLQHDQQLFSRFASEPVKSLFFDSPWYQSNGAHTLKVKLESKLEFIHDKHTEQRVHHYVVREPYQVIENVKKTRRVPFQRESERCTYNPSTQRNDCHIERTTDYRDEKYTEKEVVTRYRDVNKEKIYSGTRHEINLRINASLRQKDNLLSFDLPYDYNFSESYFSHTNSIPHINLYPVQPEIPGKQNLAETHAGIFARNFAKELSDQWQNKYCKRHQQNLDFYKNGDDINMCIQLSGADYPDSVDQWFLQNTGVDLASFKNLVSYKINRNQA